jgi:hypothetical protein
MDTVSTLTRYLVFLFIFTPLSCATEDDVFQWESVEGINHIKPAMHWHTQYVTDACKACPECCIVVTDHGFIDEYGVERPISWLPNAKTLKALKKAKD